MFPVMTMEREGCTQCLGCEGKLCLGCFACSDQCQDGMKLHAGHVSGVPGQLGTHSLIGLAHQPKGGGGLTPTVQIMDRGSYDTPPLAVVQGPSIFGGCSECCCSVPFTVTRVPGGVGVDGYKSLQIGDLATITKKKPSGFGAAMRELFTDSDLYTLEIHDATVTPQQKASLLGSLPAIVLVLYIELFLVRWKQRVAPTLPPVPRTAVQEPPSPPAHGPSGPRPCSPTALRPDGSEPSGLGNPENAHSYVLF